MRDISISSRLIGLYDSVKFNFTKDPHVCVQIRVCVAFLLGHRTLLCYLRVVSRLRRNTVEVKDCRLGRLQHIEPVHHRHAVENIQNEDLLVVTDITILRSA